MSKVERLNEMLQHELAQAINREVMIPNVLLTVVYVKTTADLKFATVGVSVLPDNMAGTALEKLKKSAGILSGILSKKTKLRQIPRFRFEFDPTEKKAAVLEKVINDLDDTEVPDLEDNLF